MTVDGLLTRWQNYLYLQDWRITWEAVPNLGKDLMRVTPTRARHAAHIQIAEKVIFEEERYNLEQLLVHELIHLIVEPIAEEYDHQQQFYIEELYKVPARVAFNRQLEKCVENLTHIIMKARNV